jgi:pimeloyl-ACP methyl ester carboxylesterase
MRTKRHFRLRGLALALATTCVWVVGTHLALCSENTSAIPAASDPDIDSDNDGLTNAVEAEIGTKPKNPNSDGDGLGDGEDAVPTNPTMQVRAAPDSNYAIIDLGKTIDVGRPVGLNDSGKVVLVKYLDGGMLQGFYWENGTMSDLGISNMFAGPLQDGTVYSALEGTYVGDIYTENLTGGGATIPYYMTGERILDKKGSSGEAPVFSFLPGDLEDDVQTVSSAYYSKKPDTNWCSLYAASYLGAVNDNHKFIYRGIKGGGHEHNEGWHADVSGVVFDTGGGTEYSHAGGWGYYWWPQPTPPEWEGGSIAALGPTIEEVNEQGIGTYVARYCNPEQGYLVLSPGSSVPILGCGRIGGITSSTVGNGEGPYFLCSLAYAYSYTRLYCYNKGTPVSIDLGGSASSVCGEVSGRSISNHLVIPMGDSLWRNGRKLLLGKLCGVPATGATGWTSPTATLISPKNNLMIGTAKKDNVFHAVLLVPVDIAVDANRDGKIDSSDNSSLDKPYRFWLNDDQDTISYADGGGKVTIVGDRTPVVTPDYIEPNIQSTRDLEDWTRLWINLNGVASVVKNMMQNGGISVGLQFEKISGNPSIKICESADPAGGTGYLTDQNLANQQISGSYDVPIEDNNGNNIIGSDPFLFPNDFWDDVDDTTTKHLIFEGVSDGKGKLKLVFYKNGQKIGEGGSVYLELMDIKYMYERGAATPDSAFIPYNSTNTIFDDSGFTFAIDHGKIYKAPTDEQKTALVFVHGWNMSYEDYISFSETMFKRMWWQGYKGIFCTFRWATLTGVDSYNTSEFRAWKYGKSLKEYVDTLTDYTVNVAAHSMGNVVAGSALKRGMSVNRYFLMEAAIPGGCYNDAVNNYPPFINREQLHPTPDTVSDLGYRLYVGPAQNNALKIINLYNINDYALAAGAYPVLGNVSWEGNQIGYKPNSFATKTYSYDKGPPTAPYPMGQRCFLRGTFSLSERPVLDIHESMSFVARPHSKAIGAEPSSSSVFPNSIDLQGYGFNAQRADHSGQFNRSTQELNDFYKSIFNEIK